MLSVLIIVYNMLNLGELHVTNQEWVPSSWATIECQTDWKRCYHHKPISSELVRLTR